METSKKEGKRIVNAPPSDEDSENEECPGEDSRKKRILTVCGRKAPFITGGTTPSYCQIQNCTVDMTGVKMYYRRHKVCGFHAKAAVVQLEGRQKRFCQQCSRFHDLSEFDEAKRSCRRRLAGHNERRRKISYDSQ